jgi:hypothetical protein
MIVPGRFKAYDYGLPYTKQHIDEAIVFHFGVRHDEASSPGLTGHLDQNVVANLRNIDRYQNGVGWRKLLSGHGPAFSKVLIRQLHFRDLRPGPDRLPA